MRKKLILILTVIILLGSLAFPAFAGDSSIEETSAKATAGIIIGLDD